MDKQVKKESVSNKVFPFSIKTIIIPAIILIVLVILLVSFGGEDKRTPCEQLQDWVDTHVAPGEKIAIDENVYKMCPIEHYITDLPGYVPSNKPIDLNVVLRGSHTMYVWVGEGEDLNMTITKQDKDWYEGKDDLNITVTGPDRKIVFEKIVPDNGIDTNENYGKPILGNPQKAKIYLEKPGKGVYKVEFNSDKVNDVILSNIIVMQKMNVFSKSIFLLNDNLSLFINSDISQNLNIASWNDAFVRQLDINSRNTIFDLNILPKQINKYSFDFGGSSQVFIDRGNVIVDFVTNVPIGMRDIYYFNPNNVEIINADENVAKVNITMKLNSTCDLVYTVNNQTIGKIYFYFC